MSPEFGGVGQQGKDAGKSCSPIQRQPAGRISSCLGEVGLPSVQDFSCLDEAHSRYVG